ncbi:MAG: hypothetical protein ACU0CJ_02650 [Sulfitobacter sp.]|jgi:hypothetical protein|uniref:hypothetical protein n=1 Tax=unclassified Sulfitobacter TaxID=196795 RepID=UPI0009EEFBE8
MSKGFEVAQRRVKDMNGAVAISVSDIITSVRTLGAIAGMIKGPPQAGMLCAVHTGGFLQGAIKQHDLVAIHVRGGDLAGGGRAQAMAANELRQNSGFAQHCAVQPEHDQFRRLPSEDHDPVAYDRDIGNTR